MSEGGRVGTRISLPAFQEEKKIKKHARFSTAAAQSGTEGERRASARKRRLFLCWSMCLVATRRRSQTKEEPGAPVRLRVLLSAVLVQPPSVMKQAGTLRSLFYFR